MKTQKTLLIVSLVLVLAICAGVYFSSETNKKQLYQVTDYVDPKVAWNSCDITAHVDTFSASTSDVVFEIDSITQKKDGGAEGDLLCRYHEPKQLKNVHLNTNQIATMKSVVDDVFKNSNIFNFRVSMYCAGPCDKRWKLNSINDVAVPKEVSFW